MTTEVATVHEGRPLEPPERELGDVIGLMKVALEHGEASVEVIERLVALQERGEDRYAERALSAAIASFQSECPEIPKTKSVNYVTRAGTKVEYNYAPLDRIAKAIRPVLVRHGLAYTWDSVTEADVVHCVCTVRHIDGASTTATFAAPIETREKMSGPQRTAAALSFARRQSLVQALGLTQTDDDIDADTAGPDDEPITREQLATLEEWIEEVGADRERFLKFLAIEELGELEQSRFDFAVDKLREKERRG